ncbi:MAG TPA: lytic transglycosylase domain-containing protein [Desulfitobacteriaceae bacterium]|nr:lytic transglycosylase domain-containing protein [Desulfitobacteriaceae bacterium]
MRRVLSISLLVLLLLWGVGQTSLFQKMAYPYPYRVTIEKYAELYGVDPLLVVAVMREESRFLPYSESSQGAVGLMQLMPDTARAIAAGLGDETYEDKDLLLPEKNIQYGIWYLVSLRKEFDNNILVLAAYNGGRGKVREWIDSNQIDLDKIRQQDIPFIETRQYVEKVLISYQMYIKLYGD